jgi:hypothetical protein
MMLPIKKNTFPILFLGYIYIYIFFVLFDDKKNKGILRYNGGTSTANIQAQDTRTRLMF